MILKLFTSECDLDFLAGWPSTLGKWDTMEYLLEIGPSQRYDQRASLRRCGETQSPTAFVDVS